MDNGFSILMLIFGAAVMLYAAILSSGNYKLLPLTVQPSLRRKDKKGQTKHIAAVTAVVAVPIILGGTCRLLFGEYRLPRHYGSFCGCYHIDCGYSS